MKNENYTKNLEMEIVKTKKDILKCEKRRKIQKFGIITSFTISGLLLLCGVVAGVSPLFTGTTDTVACSIMIGGYGSGIIMGIMTLAGSLDSKDYRIEKAEKQEILMHKENELQEMKNNNKEKELGKVKSDNGEMVESRASTVKENYQETTAGVKSDFLNEYQDQEQKNPVLVKTRNLYKK